MLDLTGHQLLTIFNWFLISILIGFLALIARAYEQISDEKTHYWRFLIPFLLLGGASVRTAFVNDLNGDTLADVLWVMGGFSLALLSLSLYNSMMSKRK
jgi:hypothetical protein